MRQGIHVASRRIKLWTEKVKQNGGKVAQAGASFFVLTMLRCPFQPPPLTAGALLQEPSSKGITHVLLEDNCIPPGVQLPEGQPLVSVAWLEACLAHQQLLPVSKSFTFDTVSGGVSCHSRVLVFWNIRRSHTRS